MKLADLILLKHQEHIFSSLLMGMLLWRLELNTFFLSEDW